MRKPRLAKAFACLSLPLSSNRCLCLSSVDAEEEYEKRTLIQHSMDSLIRLQELAAEKKTLAFHLEPKTVALRVSMHCHGCARKVEKHLKKIEGVSSIEMDLESKKVVVTGDICPVEVLKSISKVKFAELWVEPK